MSYIGRRPPRGELPRIVSQHLMWTGGCIESDYEGKRVHGDFSAYVIKGSEKTVMVDTGYPLHWPQVQRDVEMFLDGRPLDYIFPTHAELPHTGLLTQWLDKYPNAIAVGDLRDYDMYFPKYAHRMRNVKVGDRLPLGGRDLAFVPPVWRDLTSTLWAFETTARVLFVADAFSYIHYHEAGQCDHLTSEHPPPTTDLIRFFNERALHWTNFIAAERTFGDIDALLAELKPLMIASAHGGIIDTPEEILPIIKQGMHMGAVERADSLSILNPLAAAVG